MVKEHKVAILLATYNGERYLCEQIESIRGQTYNNWDLYIRDDGSNDSTIDIINRYATQYDNIHIVSDEFKGHGACVNFYRLLKFAQDNLPNYKYYLLCDQDDVWDSAKIEKEVVVAGEYSDTIPLLIYTDLMLMKYDGTVENIRMSDLHSINLVNPNDIYFNQMFVYGNTTLFNNSLLSMMTIPDDISNLLSHDHYLSFYAVSFGKCIYLNEPLTYYRRHRSNVSDLPHEYRFVDAIRRIVKYDNFVKTHSVNYNNVIFFINHAPQKTKTLNDMYRAIHDGGIESLRIIKKYRIVPGANKYNVFLNIIILLTKLHKKYLITN